MISVPPNFHLSVRKIANVLLLIGFTLIVIFIGQKENKSAVLNTEQTNQKIDYSEISSSCTNDKSYNCYVTAFKRFFDKNGPEETLDALYTLSTEDDFVKRDCHPYAHEIGRHSFKRIGNALKAFSYGRVICASGYYHGVMEGFLSKVRDEKGDLGKEIIDLCDTQDDNRFMAFQCLHGLGHGLTMYFEGDIMKSLPYCDSLKTYWEMQSCQGGVFMENIVVKDTPGHRSLYLKEDEPEYPCNIVTENQKFSCYLLISSWLLQLTKYDYSAAFNLCDGLRSDYVYVCYQSMGRDISGATLRSPTESASLCSLGQTRFYRDCVIGVIKDFTNTTAGASEGAAFCKLVKEDTKEDCYRAGGQILIDLYTKPDELEKACDTLTINEPVYKRSCLNYS